MGIMTLIVILLYSASAILYAAYFLAQKGYLQKTGYYVLFSGFLIHLVMIVIQYYKSGIFPAGNLAETLSIASWSIAGVFLLLKYKFNLKILGFYAAPLAAIIFIIACLLPEKSSEPNSLLSGFWLTIHVVTIFIGEASFALACGAGMLYLAQENAIKTKNHGFFYKRLPSLELIDSTGYACIVVGFTLLTAPLITDSIYAISVWGKFWSWDTKEVWSLISWLIYAALLHQRIAMGWRGRRAALLSIMGFAVLLFTFLGVNFLLSGHHDEFTK